MNTTNLTAALTPNPTEPSRNLTISHIVPALALSAGAVGLTVTWHTIGPRQDLLDTMRLTLLVGLAVFVVNAGYALIRFGNPLGIEIRRGWAMGIAAGLSSHRRVRPGSGPGPHLPSGARRGGRNRSVGHGVNQAAYVAPC